MIKLMVEPVVQLLAEPEAPLVAAMAHDTRLPKCRRVPCRAPKPAACAGASRSSQMEGLQYRTSGCWPGGP